MKRAGMMRKQEGVVLITTDSRKASKHLETYRAVCHIDQIPNRNPKQSYVKQCYIPAKEESVEGKNDSAAAPKLLLTEYKNTAHFFVMDYFNIELQCEKHGKDSAKGKLG